MIERVTKTTLTTSHWQSQTDTTLLSPYSPEFRMTVLEPLAQRVSFGADTLRVADDLYEAIHPWLIRFIARKSKYLPPTADLEELESRVHESALLACRTVDWNRIDTFVSLLRVRVEGAAIESARHDDWLSRRHRHMLNDFKGEIDLREQQLQRSLDAKEKQEIAKDMVPKGARRDWESDIQRQFMPTSLTPIHENQKLDTKWLPEDGYLKDEYLDIIRQWLNSLPKDVGQEAYDWAVENVDGNRNAPRPVLRKLKQYVPTLVAMLGAHFDDMGLAVEI